MKNEFWSAVLGGVIVAGFNIGADFFIKYKLVDAPKVHIDRQRILLEAHREISLLSPVLTTVCKVELDKTVPTAHAQCDVTNVGQHSVTVDFGKIDLAIVFVRPTPTPYERFRVEENQQLDDKAFRIEFLDSNRSGTTIAPQQTTTFKFDVVRPGKKEPDNTRLQPSEVAIRIALVATAVRDAAEAFDKLYPELKDFINHSSRRESTLFIRFPRKPSGSAAR